MRQELHYDPEKCIGCSSCLEVCPEGAISKDNHFFVGRDNCSICLDCTNACPATALTPLGSRWEPEAIVEKVLKDKPFFDNSGGGVTLSGGEPTLQPAYVSRLLKSLKEKNIHTLVETCGHFDFAGFCERLLPFTDSIYIDLKLIDPEAHQRHCGLANELILENIIRLHELSHSGGFEILIRIPLVPGITATEENLTATARFLQKHGIRQVELLPYNPLWSEKLFCLGHPDPYPSDHPLRKWMPRKELLRCRQIFTDYGF